MKTDYVNTCVKRGTALAVVLFPLIALACPANFTQLTIPVTPGVNASAYPTVISEHDDALIGAESACCDAVELHTHMKEDNVLRMRRVDKVELKAGKPTVFASGELHVMLIGLKKPLTEGRKIPITFHFAHAPDQTVTFTAGRLHDGADSHKHHE